MVWACANGHPVREGMFVCPVCRSEDVRDREGAEGAPPATTHSTAVARLQDFLTKGALLYLGGGLLAGVAVVIAASGGTTGGGFATFLVLVAGILSIIGIGFVLVAVVGWGVKLGNEATERVHDG